MTSKLEKFNLTIPSIYQPTINRYVKGIVEAWASEDQTIVEQLTETKDQLFVATADGRYLNLAGSGVNVPRPLFVALSDVFYRELIVKMSYAPKQIRKTFYEILDIFWGPTYSRANTTSNNAESYNFGTPSGISGTLTFTHENAIVFGSGTFFTSELDVGDYIKLTTDSNDKFVRVNHIVDDERLYLDSGYLGISKVGVANKIVPKTLTVKIDGGEEQTLVLSPVYFQDTSAITAEEIALSINASNNKVDSEAVKTTLTETNFVNLRTKTPGILGKIQVTGGTANILLDFPISEITINDLVRSTVIYEINPRELIITIPSLVARIERELLGAWYIHDDFSGTILSIDSLTNTIIVNLNKTVGLDDLVGHTFTQNIYEFEIIGNSAGQNNVTIELLPGLNLNMLQGDGSQSFSYGPTISEVLMHGLNQKYVNFELYNNTDSVFLSSSTAIDINNLELNFAVSQIGKAVIMSQNEIFNQAISSDTWSINHGLSSQYLNLVVYNSSDESISLGPTITAVDANNLTIELASPDTGNVAMMVPDYVHTQGGAATTWTVSHNLGTQYNHVTVYDENDIVIIPDSIEVVDKNTLSITFAIAQDGVAAVSSGGGASSGAFRILNPNYNSAHIFNPDGNFSITSRRTLLNQNITAGDLVLNLNVNDGADIPNEKGFIIVNFGKNNQEGPIPYNGRENNSNLIINPLYLFQKNHLIGDVVNYLSSELAYVPKSDGSDYPVFITGTEEALNVVEELLRKIKAVGVVLNLIIQKPDYRYKC